MSEILTLDQLADECGFFKDDETVNYGCTHENNTEDGKCYSWACPLAMEMYFNDFTQKQLEEFGLSKDDFDDDGAQMNNSGDVLMEII